MEIDRCNVLCVVDSEQCNNIYDNSLNTLRVSSYTFFVLFFFSPTAYESLLNNPLNLDTPVFKKRPDFLNSSPTSKEGALRLLSAPSGRF